MGQSDDGSLKIDDLWQTLPLSSHHTVQICSVMLHEMGSVVQQLPFNMMIAEYGLQVMMALCMCWCLSESGVACTVCPVLAPVLCVVQARINSRLCHVLEIYKAYVLESYVM